MVVKICVKAHSLKTIIEFLFHNDISTAVLTRLTFICLKPLFTLFSSVSVVDFELVNVRRGAIETCMKELCLN